MNSPIPLERCCSLIGGAKWREGVELRDYRIGFGRASFPESIQGHVFGAIAIFACVSRNRHQKVTCPPIMQEKQTLPEAP